MNPTPTSFVKAANFEEHLRNHGRARAYYERALVELGKRAFSESFFIAFTKFEIRQHELERAKILFEYALKNLPKETSKTINEQHVLF